MSQPQLRPNSTISTTGLSVVGGASADVVLDDAPAADGSYIQASGGSAATATLGLTDPTWPAGAVSKSARIQLRARGVSGTGRGYAELRSGSTVVAKLDLSTFGSSWTAGSTKAGAWYPITLTQAEVNALTAFVRTNKVVTTPQVQASELYVDLILAERATAAITTATTAYSTSTITTDWSHTPGADGGDQSHYRLIWLTAAQAATITGGDPTTSTAGILSDSGAVASTAGSATVAGLPDGTLTRYVATADTVNGQPHWSPWVSQAVTVTLTTAEVLTVTPIVDEPRGRIGVVITRDPAHDPWTSIELCRSVDGGTTKIPVLGASSVVPAADTVTVYDYLADPGVTYTYWARAIRSGPSAGTWVGSAKIGWLYLSGRLWLKSTTDPELNMQLWVVSDPLENTRPRQQIVHDILPDGAGGGRRIVAYGPLQGRVTELVAWTETLVEAERLRALVDGGVVVVHPPTDWRFAPGTFALGGQVEDVSGGVGTGYEYQQWRISLTEVD